MNKKNYFFLSLIMAGFHLNGGEVSAKASTTEKVTSEPISRLQIIYLAQSKNYHKAIELYNEYTKQTGKADFTILEHLAKAILEHGARSQDEEIQLLSIFSSNLAGLDSPYDILEAGITSKNMQTQLASLQFMARMQDDQIDTLLNKAMGSDFLYTRLEAAYILSARKSKASVGLIEALMHKLPPQMSYFFPELFAIIGTSEAINILRHLIDSPFPPTRIEAILSAARHNRDDLLPIIRSCSTHSNAAEQEACATALGYLNDSSSLKRLKKLSVSSSDNVQLAALRSLYFLGDESAKEGIYSKAKEKNLYAITILADIPHSEEILISLAEDPDLTIRFNAALSLLKQKDKRAIHYIKDFLIRDSRDLGFQPQSSIGNSLKTWKVISSSLQHAKHSRYDLMAVTLSVRENLLKDCLELPEESFLKVAQLIMDTKQNELIPSLVSLIENQKSLNGIALLKRKGQTAGAPLIRAYCNLALVRLKEPGPYQELLEHWILSKQADELIQFRPSLPWALKLSESNFELTPEESSSLLIESYQVLANKHDEKSIAFLLKALQDGKNANTPILAGILLKALQ
jgi:hypothetical protein